MGCQSYGFDFCILCIFQFLLVEPRQGKQVPHQVQQEALNETSTVNFCVYTDAEHFATAKSIFDEFLANPNQSKFLDASWQVSEVDRSASGGTGLKRLWLSGQPLTQGIFLLCLAVYAASYFGWFSSVFKYFGFAWSLSEPYRLITPAFIHLSDLHLAFNLGWWWYLGSRVEKLLGKQTLIIVMLLTALASNLAQALLVGSNFAGLSGVNYGLAGFVWFCGVVYKSRTLYLPNNIFVFLVVWMLLGFADLIPYVSMANWAHLCGLLAGFGLAILLVKPQGQSSKES